MATNKTDVTSGKPQTTDLITVNDGETVEAATENTNNTTVLTPLITAMNWIIDQGLQAGVESIATALQRFQGGIQVDDIDSETTGGDITITTTSTGKLKYGSGTSTASEVITTGNYSTLVTDPTGVVDMTGATNSTAGTGGLAIEPTAGTQNLALHGDATYKTGWESKTTNFTIENGGKYIVGSSVTEITLIDDPDDLSSFELTAGDATDLSAVTLKQAASGERINGVASDLLLSAGSAHYKGTLVSSLTSGTGWRVAVASSSIAVVNLPRAGRLTLESGEAVSTTDQTAKTTVYFTPYKGDRIALYDGSDWVDIGFSEVSVAVPSTTDTNFDIFGYNNNGTLALEALDWTDDTNRATAITLQNGIYVKSGDATRRLLGTGRTTSSSGETQQTDNSWLLSDLERPLPRRLFADGDAGNWSYSSTTIRAANATTTVGETRVEFILPVARAVKADLFAVIRADNAASDGFAGIALDATNANHAQLFRGVSNTTAVSVHSTALASYGGYPSAGYHYLQWVEKSNGSNNMQFWAAQTGGWSQSGLVAEIEV